MSGLINIGNVVTLVCTVKGSFVGSVAMNDCQPLHWMAEGAADRRIWLKQGGKSPFGEDLKVSRVFIAMYFLGTTLPEGHVCIEQIAYQRCIDGVNIEKQMKDNETMLRASIEKWSNWLQLPEVQSSPSA